MKRIKDSIYGTYSVDEVIWELINTSTFQRLKKIHQGGGIFLVDDRWSTTRFEHSVGTMILSKLLGANLLEQIASLLHDISHTAFSHVVDYVLDNKDENHHDTIFESYISSSDITVVLEKYNIEISDLLACDYYPLEAPLPELSIDRIDYALRDFFSLGLISLEDVKSFISNLTLKGNVVCVKNMEEAEWFHKFYLELTTNHYRMPLNVYANFFVTKLLKLALENEIITLIDFNLGDLELIDKILSSGNQDVREIFHKIKNTPALELTDREEDIRTKYKIRVIDPNLYINEQVYKLSDLLPHINTLNLDAIRTQEVEVKIKITE